MDIQYEKIPIKMRILIISICAIPILFLFLYVNWNDIFNPRSRAEVFLEIRLEQNCSGKIDSIYRQKNNHNILTLQTKDCNFQVDYPWENKFQLGDSISKKATEPTIKIFRKNKLVEILDYRDIAKTIK